MERGGDAAGRAQGHVPDEPRSDQARGHSPQSQGWQGWDSCAVTACTRSPWGWAALASHSRRDAGGDSRVPRAGQEHSTCQSTAAHGAPQVLHGWEVQAAPRLHQQHRPLRHLCRDRSHSQLRAATFPRLGQLPVSLTELLDGAGEAGAPIPQRKPSCTHPSVSRTGTATPPSPALQPEDIPFLLLFERDPCAVPLAARKAQEHPAPQHPTALRSPLPAHPRGRVKPTFIGGLAME